MGVADEKEITGKSHAEQAADVSEDFNQWMREMREQIEFRPRNMGGMHAQEDSQIPHEPIVYVEEMKATIEVEIEENERT